MVKPNTWISFVLKLTGTLLLCAVILARMDLSQVGHLLVNVQPEPVVIMLVIWFMALVVSALRWQSVLTGYGLRQTLWQTISLYWIGSFFNNFLPTSIGGDSYKFLHVRKIFPGKDAAILSSLIVERGCGLIAILVFAAAFGGYFFDVIKNNAPFAWCYAFVIASIIVIPIVLWLIQQHLVHKSVRSGLLQKLITGLETFFSLQHHRSLVLFRALGLSIFFLILNIVAYWYGFRAIGEHMPLLVLCAIVPCIQLSRMIPLTLNSIGIAEGAGIYFFSLFGVSYEVALSVLLLNRVVGLFATFTGGFRYLSWNAKKTT
ncbi:MAG: flippase-like domain-containing protein [Candidatus Kerfeldbacteria bacterium]|nr:flippase-like domain-containing protein [Candidatus Kerfeldbacteria bacterium]